jgi:hypothetical protein
MHARFFNRISKGNLAWLLGILLLMPLAQTAAAWHQISHTQSQASETRGPQSGTTVADYCDLCQIAAATGGGLLPTQSQAFSATAAPCAVPRFTCQSAAAKPLWQPYASRAPPYALS